MSSRRAVVVGQQAMRQVAFLGPYGVGKSTAVRALSDVAVVSTDVRSAYGSYGRHHADVKSTTTVGIDYGEWRSPVGRIGLYGTPGQKRFQASREQVLSGTRALVLLLFGHTRDALEEADEWLAHLDAASIGSRMTVGLTRRELGGGPPLEEFRALLDEHHPQIEMLPTDPRSRDEVARAVRSALRRPMGASGTRGKGAPAAKPGGVVRPRTPAAPVGAVRPADAARQAATRPSGSEQAGHGG